MTAIFARVRPRWSLRRGPSRRWLRRIGILCVVLITISGTCRAGARDELGQIDLALYGRLLSTHTRAVPDIVGTRVDYASLKTSSDWKRLANQVHAAQPSRLTRGERLAFWINAYNILTIDLILDHYPVDSIRDIGSFFFPVWKKTVATIEGRQISLGFIEHEILRKTGDWRIHAAIVCASTSCPPLARTPFRAETIDADLAAATDTWLVSREKGIAIDRESHRVRLSSIFDWFEEDFESSGGVLSAVAPYVSESDATWLGGPGRNATIRYFDYDWALNDFE